MSSQMERFVLDNGIKRASILLLFLQPLGITFSSLLCFCISSALRWVTPVLLELVVHFNLAYMLQQAACQ